MNEEEEKNLGIWGLRVRHGRATTGTGRANLLAFLDFGKAWDGTAVPSFWHIGLKKFSSVFLNLARTITYKTT